MPKRKRTGLSSLGTLITAMSISLMACGAIMSIMGVGLMSAM